METSMKLLLHLKHKPTITRDNLSPILNEGRSFRSKCHTFHLCSGFHPNLHQGPGLQKAHPFWPAIFNFSTATQCTLFQPLKKHPLLLKLAFFSSQLLGIKLLSPFLQLSEFWILLYQFYDTVLIKVTDGSHTEIFNGR